MKKTAIILCFMVSFFPSARAFFFKMPNAAVLAMQLEQYGLSHIDRRVALSQKMANKELTPFQAMRLIEVALYELRENYFKDEADEQWRALVFTHELWAKHMLYEVLLPPVAQQKLQKHWLLPGDELGRLGIEMPKDVLEKFQNS